MIGRGGQVDDSRSRELRTPICAGHRRLALPGSAAAVGAAVARLDPSRRSRQASLIGLRPGSRAIFVHRGDPWWHSFDRHHPGSRRRRSSTASSGSTKRTVYRGREAFRRTHTQTACTRRRIPQFTSLPQHRRTERYLRGAVLTSAGGGLLAARVAEVARRSTSTATASRSAPSTARRRRRLHRDRRRRRPLGGAQVARHRDGGVTLRGGPLHRGRCRRGPRSTAPDPPRVHYEHPGIDHRNVLLVPFAGRSHVDLQLEEDDDPEEFASTDGVRRWLPRDGRQVRRSPRLGLLVPVPADRGPLVLRPVGSSPARR